jgi:succinoglycan biosynthesis protein ExoM
LVSDELKAKHLKDYISICICTYKRSKLLARLVKSLQHQDTNGSFTYSIVIVDNDYRRSSEQTVEELKRKSSIPISYCVEPEQNIAMARNRAVKNAKGDFITFIDDDEIPCDKWLMNLYKTCDDFHADGVLGPVIPYYEVSPPGWVLNGKFYDRPFHKTGDVLHWRNTRTGNVMFKRDIFDNEENFFRREFGCGGEDRDFFKRMIAKNYLFVWCAEAPVHEVVTSERCKRSFMLRRALKRGQLPHFRTIDFAKSMVAIPFYTASLPVLFVAGHHLFMKYLIKDFDHIGRLLYLCGINVVKEKYVVG